MLSQEGSRIRVGGAGICRHRLIFLHHVAFTRRQEEVLLDAVLLGIKLVIAAAEIEQ